MPSYVLRDGCMVRYVPRLSDVLSSWPSWIRRRRRPRSVVTCRAGIITYSTLGTHSMGRSPTLRTVMPAAWSSIAAGCQMKTFPIRTSLFRARPSQSQHHRGLWARSPRLATARCGLAALPPFSWWPHFVSGPSQHTHTTHTSNARDTSSQPAPTKKCSFHQHSIRRRIITTQPSPVPPYPHRNPHHHTAHSIESAILSFQQTHTRPHLQIPPTHKHHHASHR